MFFFSRFTAAKGLLLNSNHSLKFIVRTLFHLVRETRSSFGDCVWEGLGILVDVAINSKALLCGSICMSNFVCFWPKQECE